jgi:Zn-dependent M28 family amino/carboxypeptidase
MTDGERRALALNINLDTVGGDARLTALTSEFAGLPGFVREAAATAGMSVGTHAPMMANSDHYNFARHGVPALRLVAGFEQPGSNVRHILTGGDTRDKVALAELRSAGTLAAALAWRSLAAAPEILQALR